MPIAGSSRTSPIAPHNHGTPRMSCLWCGASTGYAAGSRGINEVDGWQSDDGLGRYPLACSLVLHGACCIECVEW